MVDVLARKAQCYHGNNVYVCTKSPQKRDIHCQLVWDGNHKFAKIEPNVKNRNAGQETGPKPYNVTRVPNKIVGANSRIVFAVHTYGCEDKKGSSQDLKIKVSCTWAGNM